MVQILTTIIFGTPTIIVATTATWRLVPSTKTVACATHRSFFLDTIHLNEQWLLNAGIRYDSFKVNDDKNDLSRKDNMFNYQAGVVYKPLPNGSIYLSYGTSSNPSGENLGQAGGADGPAGAAQVRDLKPERSQSWELGTKWDIADERLSLTAAIFETEKKDARSHAGDEQTVTLGGQNRVRGLELRGPRERLHLSGVSGLVTST